MNFFKINRKMMNEDILNYNDQLTSEERDCCDLLMKLINENLVSAESKVWHGHPVWFIDGNPIVGYSKQKAGIRLMFWSGVSFDETNLSAGTGKFKDASIFYNSVKDVKKAEIKRWLKKAKVIQWDYKNIVKRKGRLELLNVK
jgi:hypothetical protein